MKLRARFVFLTVLAALSLPVTSPRPASAQGTSEGDQQVDQTPLDVKVVRRFPNLRMRRPVLITHAGDGSDRLFVLTQQGVVHVMPNDQAVREPRVFLDIEHKVVYKDEQNEEGLLGLAFHPKYKENGEFFLYYTTTDAPHTSVISRFRVSEDDPNRANPDSEEEILRIAQPFWNHNGGTLEFGPDGYLYIGLGDGGAANDPHMNGQNLQTLLGSILRIDIDRKDGKRNYAIPPDNPFVDAENLARPEIYAYGIRNVWRIAFDLNTGLLWAGDVGQNLWEEVDIIEKGGNYGWNLREGMHPFGPGGADPCPRLIEPIWEYHHDDGKSITGGCVYYGKRVPELHGAYLYADYVTGRFWALWYDPQSKRVTANRELQGNGMPIMSFGMDESGEVYCTDAFGFIYGFEKASP